MRTTYILISLVTISNYDIGKTEMVTETVNTITTVQHKQDYPKFGTW